MNKIYTVILHDRLTGEYATISINGCGMPMVKHHADVYCKRHGITHIRKRPVNPCFPVNKTQAVWECDMPHVKSPLNGKLMTDAENAMHNGKVYCRRNGG